jgi:surface polysaccharide O-acyltransferase-like enzyme
MSQIIEKNLHSAVDEKSLSRDSSPEKSITTRHGDSHFDGFDYLRFFFMVMVLFAHTDFFAYFGNQYAKNHGPGANFWDVLYLQVQSCAVPTFVLMSMVLFCAKPPTLSRAWNRIKKLGYLYGFWVGAWVVHSGLRPAPTLYGVVEFLVRGGGWVLYTFFVLMLMTLVCCLAEKMKKFNSWLGPLLAIMVIICTFAYLVDDLKWTRKMYYWVPFSFVFAPFIAVWLTPKIHELRESGKLRWKVAGIFIILAVISAFIEWHFSAAEKLHLEWRSFLPKHARPSVHFTAVAVIVLSLAIQTKAPRWVLFFARNSLGVYCLHPFILRGVAQPVIDLVNPIAPNLSILAAVVVLAVFCSFISEFLRKAFKERLI